MSRQVEPRFKQPREAKPTVRFRLRRIGRKSAAWQRSRAWAQSRAGGRCEARIDGVCDGAGTDAHHMLRRAQGGSDGIDNLLWVCRSCHRWIHDHPAQSYEAGWLRRPAS